jgi:hypothetical protein
MSRFDYPATPNWTPSLFWTCPKRKRLWSVVPWLREQTSVANHLEGHYSLSYRQKRIGSHHISIIHYIHVGTKLPNSLLVTFESTIATNSLNQDRQARTQARRLLQLLVLANPKTDDSTHTGSTVSYLTLLSSHHRYHHLRELLLVMM